MKRRSRAGAAILAALAAGLAGAPTAATAAAGGVGAAPAAGLATGATGPTVSVIVREAPGAGDGPEQRVRDLGGRVDRQIGLIRAFTAELSAGNLPALRSASGVAAVTEDARVTLTGYDGFEPKSDWARRGTSRRR